jgi:hypothetical protein
MIPQQPLKVIFKSFIRRSKYFAPEEDPSKLFVRDNNPAINSVEGDQASARLARIAIGLLPSALHSYRSRISKSLLSGDVALSMR